MSTHKFGSTINYDSTKLLLSLLIHKYISETKKWFVDKTGCGTRQANDETKNLTVPSRDPVRCTSRKTKCQKQSRKILKH